ncbi:galactosamine-6-phosphate isomerase [Escherichia coli O55:H7 str. RM12579]|nr:galactosamine-6-phosphate isomerase [Escherichia coli O55:H7 str. RM12579]EHV26814.1 putative galactosamine-6-phosphate isomerase [Escherichia coli DEC5B]EHV35004.1 putative galactosamine-6-phosphate isomerase [Escherichia coli DEC5C]EHV46079.1 putative galactosamine-6-phosphate isomerase [Escherichia coli DEC5E]EKH90416.1 putative galactosamine-6-phosphate isomerase [Escherichia coli 5905]EYZ64646.1 galactosamine-6-phosphate isomerase [Escherichia coli O55:H7 str. 06-3555]CAD5514645.1 gal
MQTLQQVENYTALSERASEYLLAVIRSKPDAGDLPGDRSHAITDVSLSGRKNPLAAG